MKLESNTYRRLIEIGLALTIEKDIDGLLERILREAKEIADADAGSIYLKTPEGSLRFVIVLNDSLDIYEGGTSETAVSLPEVPLENPDGTDNMANIASRCAIERQTIIVDDSYTSNDFDFTGTRRFDEMTGYRSTSFLSVPFKNFADECIGVLQLLNAQSADGAVIPFSPQILRVIEALASQASIAIENRSLLDQHDELKSQLEHQVETRTRELQDALARLEEAHATLMEMTTIDPVTGIRNRGYFDDVFQQEVRRASRQRYDLALLLLDIDLFKNVNDTFEHLACDECLRGVAQEIDSMLNRPSDVVARYGGEEFVVILPYVSESNAVQLADQLRGDLARKVHRVNGNDISITVSIGVSAAIPGEDKDCRVLIDEADEALYRAKASGRNQVCGYGA